MIAEAHAETDNISPKAPRDPLAGLPVDERADRAIDRYSLSPFGVATATGGHICHSPFERHSWRTGIARGDGGRWLFGLHYHARRRNLRPS